MAVSLTSALAIAGSAILCAVIPVKRLDYIVAVWLFVSEVIVFAAMFNN